MDMTTTSNTTKAVFMKCASTKDPHAIMLLLPWYLRIYNYWMEIKISVTVPRSVKQNKNVGQGKKKFDHNKAMPLSVKLRLTSKS